MRLPHYCTNYKRTLQQTSCTLIKLIIALLEKNQILTLEKPEERILMKLHYYVNENQ